MITTTNIG